MFLTRCFTYTSIIRLKKKKTIIIYTMTVMWWEAVRINIDNLDCVYYYIG